MDSLEAIQTRLRNFAAQRSAAKRLIPVVRRSHPSLGTEAAGDSYCWARFAARV
jgi:hypothetical protein